MTTHLLPAALLLAISGMGGCFKFSIEEKIYLRNDGSGSFRYGIDVTETFVPLLIMMRSLDSLNIYLPDDAEEKPQTDEDFMEEIITDFKEGFDFTATGMHKVEGISNYEAFVDTAGGKFVMGFLYDFTSVENLNKAQSTFYESLKKKGENPSEAIFSTFTFSDNTLSRTFISNGKEVHYTDADTADGGIEAALAGMGNEFTELTYTVIYEFEREIAEVHAPEAGMLKERNRVTLNYDMEGILRSLLKSEVRLK